jgi:hypothetical protein
MTYTTISAYIGSKSNARDKIAAIEIMIDTMFLRMTEAVEGQASNVDEYELNDGQIKIRTRYRSVEDIESGIKALEKLKQRYVNQYNGRQFVIRDVRGLH